MIPKTFHRIWLKRDALDDIPPQFENHWTKLRELHPDWAFVTWDGSTALDWLVNQRLFEHFDNDDIHSFGFRSDILRYEVLNKFGGVYVDTDVEPFRPFDPLLEDPRPFVAWCSDAELDPAVIASPQGHPAIQALVDDLPAVEDLKPKWTPPGVTGPFFVTRKWRHRDDVRRLPPVTFFPFHWKEMKRINDDPPPDSFARHLWAAGWKVPRNAKRVVPVVVTPTSTDVPISVVIPFRGNEERQRLLDFIHWNMLRAVNGEVIFGTDDGEDPFHKTLAINRAAAKATHDILCIMDADTWVSPAALAKGAALIKEHGYGWVQPWSAKWKLGREATETLLATPDWDGTIPPYAGRQLEQKASHPSAPPLMVTREAFEAVNGMDERMRGWGHEDDAFMFALKAMGYTGQRGTDPCVHLWHPRIGKAGNDQWPDQDGPIPNAELMVLYKAAQRSKRLMQVVTAGNRSS